MNLVYFSGMRQWLEAVLLCAALCGTAHAEVRLRLVEAFPSSPAPLAHWQRYYLRVAYTSDQPVRIGADPFLGAAAVPGTSSGSPVSAAGSGEALYWIAYTKPARVDRLVIYATDESWAKRLATLEVPVQLAWTGEKAAPVTPPEWVSRLQAARDAQQRLEAAARAREPVNPAWGFAFFLAGWSIPGYFALQGFLLWRWRGGWRIAAAIPAVPMAIVLGHAIFALIAGSNLFPLFLLFLCPPALLYLLAVAAVRKARVGAFVA